jgi:rod shape-determining protein MreC
VYDSKTVRRRRAVLGLLVACSLILVTASFGDGLRSIERGALEVFGPIQEGASRVLKPVRDAAGWVGDTMKAKGEVARIRKERDEYRNALLNERGSATDNVRLRGLLGRDRRLSLQDQGPVTARVYGRSPTVLSSTLTVNKGSKDGIREDQPVVSGAGLVGRVDTVSRSSAVILLITDGNSGVSAKVQESGTFGIVRTAVGDPEDLRLEYLGRDARQIRKDYSVVTSGTTASRYESLFPPGIPVGRVTAVDSEGRNARVRPYVSLRDLEFVQILTRPQT